MNLNLFRTYVKVVETQNLSRTAEEFGLSQPAVTKQIQALEDMYGVLLLERSGRRLKTTEAGETLYNCAREIIKAMDKADKAMEELSESRKGSLYLGASTIPGQYILPAIIKKFKDKYPAISISMDVADTEKIFYKAAERELDIGVVGGWINSRKVDGFKWMPDELVLIVPINHKLAECTKVRMELLAGERWIFREKGSGTQKALEELLASNGIKKDDVNVYIEAGSTEAVIASVESEMGISVISGWAARTLDRTRKIKIIKIDDVNAVRDFYIIYPRQKTRRKSVNNFIEFIKKQNEKKKLE
ncbi:MAG TPA: selenium metabolism-associated LysR family transcriptional regulator [Syntrophomonadaceae bacterium]|nr:selenium metabolism-associated LysR family transcriptional regulator [Syntrophomonadaceae bacterium]